MHVQYFFLEIKMQVEVSNTFYSKQGFEKSASHALITSTLL